MTALVAAIIVLFITWTLPMMTAMVSWNVDVPNVDVEVEEEPG